MRLLLDINVLLDVVFNRSGADASSEILDLCEDGSHHGEVAWHTLPTVFYYLEKSRTAQESWEFIENLTNIVHVVSAGHAEVKRVFDYGMKDFEDALQVSAAVAAMPMSSSRAMGLISPPVPFSHAPRKTSSKQPPPEPPALAQS